MTTGTDLEWPADLPCPRELPTQSAERRFLGDGNGPFELRVGQTDRKAFEEYAFPPYSPAQALALDTFWTVTLNRGGKWFSAPWPRPEGQVATARRFVGPPSWEYIHTGKEEGGYWRVSGVFEVRGVGELPVEPDPPSAWNPLDELSGLTPVPLFYSDDFRLSTRDRNSTSYEGGVRGTLSHSTLGKWYVELLIVSTGDGANPIVDNQNLSLGLVDDSKDNVITGGGDNSNYATSGLNWLLCYTRFDSAIAARVAPPIGAFVYTGSGQPQPGDVYGFAWHVGTDIRVYINGTLVVTVPFAYAGPMFPYMSAGSTLVNGPDTVGEGESVLICTNKKQFAYYPPSGYYDWG